jgi:hypothetical protein
MPGKRTSIMGVGINDADYNTNPRVNGKKVKCPIYAIWCGMINRCYNKSELERFPSYVGCYVCEDWLLFSNFRSWVLSQDWVGKHLDKDIIVNGNKKYSPETCAFVDGSLNMFFTESTASRGEHKIGVHFHKAHGKFMAYCRNPFKKKQEFLGYFQSEEPAHLAWKLKKKEHAKRLAEMQTDSRVAKALIERYS